MTLSIPYVGQSNPLLRGFGVSCLLRDNDDFGSQNAFFDIFFAEVAVFFRKKEIASAAACNNV